MTASTWCTRNLRKSTEGPHSHSALWTQLSCPRELWEFLIMGVTWLNPFALFTIYLNAKKKKKKNAVSCQHLAQVTSFVSECSATPSLLTSSHYDRFLRKWHFSK